jgi:hypothetical protein
MIARKNLGATQRHAAGGSRERFYARITRAAWFGLNKDATGRGGIRRRSREPPANTRRAGKPNVPIARIQRRTVKSGSPPGTGRVHHRGSSVFSSETAFDCCLAYFRAFFAASITLFSTSAGSSW